MTARHYSPGRPSGSEVIRELISESVTLSGRPALKVHCSAHVSGGREGRSGRAKGSARSFSNSFLWSTHWLVRGRGLHLIAPFQNGGAPHHLPPLTTSLPRWAFHPRTSPLGADSTVRQTRQALQGPPEGSRCGGKRDRAWAWGWPQWPLRGKGVEGPLQTPPHWVSVLPSETCPCALPQGPQPTLHLKGFTSE